MQRNFTLNDLFLYHYNELNTFETQEIEYLIATDETFRAEYADILAMNDWLDTAFEKPSTTSVRYILEHDKENSSELVG